jgi:hypothetical protein
MEELFGTRYQSGSFSFFNVGSGFLCLRSYFGAFLTAFSLPSPFSLPFLMWGVAFTACVVISSFFFWCLVQSGLFLFLKLAFLCYSSTALAGGYSCVTLTLTLSLPA